MLINYHANTYTIYHYYTRFSCVSSLDSELEKIWSLSLIFVLFLKKKTNPKYDS